MPLTDLFSSRGHIDYFMVVGGEVLAVAQTTAAKLAGATNHKSSEIIATKANKNTLDG
jgi:hypothetical protein